MLCKYSVLNYCANMTTIYRMYAMYVGREVWIFQESPFPGSRESVKKVHCFSRKVPIITDESKQNLKRVLAETCEVKNGNFEEYPSNRSQNTQNNLHSSSRKLDLTINPPK